MAVPMDVAASEQLTVTSSKDWVKQPIKQFINERVVNNRDIVASLLPALSTCQISTPAEFLVAEAEAVLKVAHRSMSKRQAKQAWGWLDTAVRMNGALHTHALQTCDLNDLQLHLICNFEGPATAHHPAEGPCRRSLASPDLRVYCCAVALRRPVQPASVLHGCASSVIVRWRREFSDVVPPPLEALHNRGPAGVEQRLKHLLNERLVFHVPGGPFKDILTSEMAVGAAFHHLVNLLCGAVLDSQPETKDQYAYYLEPSIAASDLQVGGHALRSTIHMGQGLWVCLLCVLIYDSCGVPVPCADSLLMRHACRSFRSICVLLAAPERSTTAYLRRGAMTGAKWRSWCKNLKPSESAVFVPEDGVHARVASLAPRHLLCFDDALASSSFVRSFLMHATYCSADLLLTLAMRRCCPSDAIRYFFDVAVVKNRRVVLNRQWLQKLQRMPLTMPAGVLNVLSSARSGGRLLPHERRVFEAACQVSAYTCAILTNVTNMVSAAMRITN